MGVNVLCSRWFSMKSSAFWQPRNSCVNIGKNHFILEINKFHLVFIFFLPLFIETRKSCTPAPDFWNKTIRRRLKKKRAESVLLHGPLVNTARATRRRSPDSYQRGPDPAAISNDPSDKSIYTRVSARPPPGL